MGALLDLHIGFGYVLSHDTQAEKLQAADEDDDTDGGSPAWDRIIEDQLRTMMATRTRKEKPVMVVPNQEAMVSGT
mgnify:CR=1 FL=1